MGPVPSKSLLIFDGDCSFCRRWVKRWQSISGDLVDYEPYQTAATRVSQISIDQFKRAAYLVEPDGTIRLVARAWAVRGRTA